MRRLISVLAIATVLLLGPAGARAKGFRDSFAGQAIASLINRLPQKAAVAATPQAKPGVMQKLRAWAASPPKATPPKAANSVKAPPASGLRNGGFGANLQARWKAFTTGAGQRVQTWRGTSTAFFARLRAPQQIVRLNRREAAKTAQAAARHEPVLWQRVKEIVKGASLSAKRQQIKLYGFFLRQQHRRDMKVLSTAAL